MSEKRLHPIAAVLNAFRQVKELFIPLMLFIVFGSKNTQGDLFYLIASSGAVLFILLSGFLSWYRFTYRLEENELRIEYGLIIRKKRYIPFERIQSLDVSEGILQRLFGLVKVKVETAGSGGGGKADAEAVLTAISKEESVEIRKYIASFKHHSSEGEEDQTSLQEEILYRISTRELILLASTSGGAGVVISAVFAFFFQFEEIIPFEKVFEGFEGFLEYGVIFISIIVFFGLLFAWFIALLGTMLNYANFTVSKIDDELIIKRGLLEKRQITIPLHRIQAIRITENLIRQPLGLASVLVESAGGGGGEDGGSRVMLLPLVKKGNIPSIIENHIGDYHSTSVFKPSPKRAISRFVFRGTVYYIPIFLIPVFFFGPWGLLTFLLLAPLTLWAFLNHKDIGWETKGSLLILQYRKIVKNTVFINKNKIQAIRLKESFLQKRKQLSSLEAVNKAGSSASGGRIIDISDRDALFIYKWYANDTDAKADSTMEQ